MTYIFYLDRYHLGDPLFLNQLARRLADLRAAKVLVHGAGEEGERLLEAEGGVATWRDGILVVGSEAEHRIVERAARDLNRRIVHALNEAGVAGVSIDGGSRGLLRQEEDGVVQVHEVGWLVELVEQGAVPVVAALVPSESGAMRQLNSGAVAGLLAHAMGDAAVVFFLREGRVPDGESVTLEEVPGDALPERAAVEAARSALAEVLLCRPRGIGEAGLQAVSLRI